MARRATKIAPTPPASENLLDIETWPISRLIPYPQNALTHPQASINKIASSLKAFGWQQCIVAEEDATIVMGHGRRLAALQLGWTEAPVHVVRGLSQEQLKALRLADNRSSSESSWDQNLLMKELIDLKGLKFDLGLTGFAPLEIDSLLSGKGVDGKKPKAGRQRNGSEPAAANTPVISYNIIFANEDDQRKWFDFLKRLRTLYPEIPTVAERIVLYCESNQPKASS